ncbi:MAG: RHS repeat-associated core domain-containing protein, partial [Gammaproteobacteria bacterium]
MCILDTNTAPDEARKNTGNPNCSCQEGDPINVGVGNVYETAIDYRAHSPFGLVVRRSYNSFVGTDSLFGYGWSSNLDRKIVIQKNYTPPGGGSSYTRLSVYRPDGRVFSFQTSGYAPSPETPSDLGAMSYDASSGGYTYLADSGQTEDYNTQGQLTSVVRQDGLTRTYQYDANGNLTSVTGPFGRTLAIAYDGSGHIATITDPAGGQYTYGYDSNDNLTSVENPDGRYVYYQYGDASYPHALTAILNNDDTTHASWSYGSQGRAIQYSLASGLHTISVAYNDADASADVTDSSGATQHITFTTTWGTVRFASTDNPCVGCFATTKSATYGDQGTLASSTDMNGTHATYTYLLDGLQSSRTEAAGTSLARTVNTTWNTALRLPTDITDSVQDQAFTYNDAGQLTSKTVTDVASGAARATSYAYGSNELLSSITGPRTDVTQTTSFTYDASGDVATLTDAAGHETQFTAYDGNGNPTAIIMPNGGGATLTYDPMQRITSVDHDGSTTGFTYNTNGWLSELTLPNGETYTYGYDAAGWVTSITDAAGNEIVYARDGAGNITQRQVKNAAGTVTETQSRTYNALEQLATIVGSAGQTASYGYDGNGNVTAYTNPDNKSWGYAYDVLNRLSTITRPDGNTVGYAYNSRGDITHVTDPRDLATNYTVNGFDETTQRVSPDTGTTSYTYDAAGNPTSRTDANGVTARYYYDALNRLTAISFGPSQNENAAFSYDQGTHGVGHLTGYSNGYDQTSLAYDVLGRVTSETSTIYATGNVTQSPSSGTAPSFTVTYGYDAAGNLTYLGYPDGLHITYTRDAAGRVTAVDTWSGKTRIPIATAISWQPFGPLASLSFANGLTETRSYTQDGWLSSLVLGSPALVNKSLGYDAAGNVTAITDNLNGANSQGFGYDALNELTSANGAYGALGYGYDSDGNRTTFAAGSATSGYGYASDSNWLLSVTGQNADTFQYDADGDVTAEGNTTYGYDAAGRLVMVDGGARASYGYNALGERVSKVATAGKGMATTLFVYDQAGHLLGEYAGNGAMEKEYIWLRNRPIAVITPSGTNYIQTDQRDAPRTITDSSGSVVWQWNPTPFGTGQPTGSFTFNLRYPGQYFDAETGNVYNHARYYDPALGRYLQSDPLGLAAGVNTYAYVAGNPLTYVDFWGLYWEYCIDTGQISHVSAKGTVTPIGTGYSGRGTGFDNSADQTMQGHSGQKNAG